tara:strand:+ start:521 stop:1471 length:951 start_codon:yes stop_codon:yes gene_type:complete
MNKLKKIVVTGGSGFVGKPLIEFLLEKKFHVIALQHKSNFTDIRDPNFFVADIQHVMAKNGSILKDATALVHLAAKTHGRLHDNQKTYLEYKKINVELTEKICSLSIANNIKKIIYLSSIKTIGESSPIHGFEENTITNPKDAYGRTKLEAEKLIENLCGKTNTDYIILRSPLVYGPSAKGNLNLLKKLINLKLPLPFKKINNKRSFIYIDNLIEAISTCINNDAINNRMYLISDNDSISTPDLIYKVAEAMEKKIILFNFPIFLLRLFAIFLRQTPKFERLSNNLVINNSNFKNDYNWSPRFNIDAGIKKSFKEN